MYLPIGKPHKIPKLYLHNLAHTNIKLKWYTKLIPQAYYHTSNFRLIEKSIRQKK